MHWRECQQLESGASYAARGEHALDLKLLMADPPNVPRKMCLKETLEKVGHPVIPEAHRDK